MVSQVPEHLLRFLPGAFTGWVDQAVTNRLTSSREVLSGALMIADLSGFTRLTAKLTSDHGRLGVERTSRILNDLVEFIVEVVDETGGTILNFEGDALVSGWRCGSDEAEMPLAAWSASHCAHLLQKRTEGRLIESESLGLRSGVAAGAIHLIDLVLAPDDRRLVLAGPCMADVAHCATLAESGQVLVSGAAWQHVRSGGKGRIHEADLVELLSLDPPPLGSRPADTARADLTELEFYLPAALRARPEWATSAWLAELRTATSLFVRVTGPKLPDDLDLTESVMQAVRATVIRYRGEMLRIAACEGGLQALVAFGMPGLAHRDDPTRAMLCALELNKAIGTGGVDISIAAATGDTFCGALGTGRCAEYTVLGNPVNRAARLAAVAAGRILADKATAESAGDKVRFQGPWGIQVPGLRSGLTTYVAVGPQRDGVARPGLDLVGRQSEIERLLAWSEQAGGGARATIIEGEGGVGKTAVLEGFLEIVRGRNIRLLLGSANEIECNTPHFAFRRIIHALIGSKEVGVDEIERRLAKALERSPEQLSFIPLLNNVVDLGIRTTPICEQLSSAARAENLRHLLRQLILDGFNSAMGVIAIEDVHWLDSASDLLVKDLAASGVPIAFVMTTRGEYPRLDAPTTMVRLAPLGPGDTARLTSSLLGKRAIPPSVQAAIWDRTGGNPFFVTELCRALLPEQVRAGSGEKASLQTKLVALPESAQAAVLSRTDLLPANDLFVLKVASAMAGSFSAGDLAELSSLQKIGPEVTDCVSRLASQHLLRAEAQDGTRYRFNHAITREAVYASMVSHQRQEAHAAIAEALEKNGPPSDAEMLPLILKHWQGAENEPKIFEYLDRVARLRLGQSDNESAIELIDAFLDLATRVDPPPSPKRLAGAHFARGEAALNLGRMAIARQAFEEGLGLLGFRPPQDKRSLAFGLGQQVTEHLLRSGRNRFVEKFRQRLGAPNARIGDDIMIEAANAHGNLTQIYYFLGDKLRILHSTLCSINLAERISAPFPVLAVNYASLGAICGVVPLRRRAERYLKLASRLSEDVGDNAATARVKLFTGLYRTAVGDWKAAQGNFEVGLALTAKLGEKRRWCELAVSLETILNPGLLNSSFPGADAWGELVEEICVAARRRGDLQVLGCGLTAAIRGYRALGRPEVAAVYLPALEELVKSQQDALEPIHVLEGSAMLAEQAARRGDLPEQLVWLEHAARSLETIRPSMKSRTLPALTTVFVTADRDVAAGGTPDLEQLCRSLASRSSAGLSHFAKVYPIGRPRAFLFRGDLEARRGRRRHATRWWTAALDEALRLEMCADAVAAAARLNDDLAARRSLGTDDRVIAMTGRNSFLQHHAVHAGAALGRSIEQPAYA
ncbi:AAA family ATPase [Bosea sp. (in: a-proteobacteria)]|uniref:AAA family ATPase n=1 Tax=Bosea sp. (in: a-proteobacteria) TaxID=1871050 RepID=UPI002FC7FF04